MSQPKIHKIKTKVNNNIDKAALVSLFLTNIPEVSMISAQEDGSIIDVDTVPARFIFTRETLRHLDGYLYVLNELVTNPKTPEEFKEPTLKAIDRVYRHICTLVIADFIDFYIVPIYEGTGFFKRMTKDEVKDFAISDLDFAEDTFEQAAKDTNEPKFHETLNYEGVLEELYESLGSLHHPVFKEKPELIKIVYQGTKEAIDEIIKICDI